MLEYGRRWIADRLMVVIARVRSEQKRQHFLTVGYTDEAGQVALIFKVESTTFARCWRRSARTGRKIEFQDEEARKGPGMIADTHFDDAGRNRSRQNREAGFDRPAGPWVYGDRLTGGTTRSSFGT